MDETQPRYYCPLCGMVEYCRNHLRSEFPPDAAKKALTRRHAKAGCMGGLVYAAGVQPGGAHPGALARRRTY